jgi:hypothetical protein
MKQLLKNSFLFVALAVGFCTLFAILGWMFIGLAFSLEGSSPSFLMVGLFSIVGFILVFPIGTLAIFLSDLLPLGIDDNLATTIAIVSNGLFWFSTAAIIARAIKRRKNVQRQ